MNPARWAGFVVFCYLGSPPVGRVSSFFGGFRRFLAGFVVFGRGCERGNSPMVMRGVCAQAASSGEHIAAPAGRIACRR